MNKAKYHIVSYFTTHFKILSLYQDGLEFDHPLRQTKLIIDDAIDNIILLKKRHQCINSVIDELFEKHSISPKVREIYDWRSCLTNSER